MKDGGHCSASFDIYIEDNCAELSSEELDILRKEWTA